MAAVELLTAALAVSVLFNVYQSRRAAVMARCHSWGIGSQGAWRWRSFGIRLLAWLIPVDVVHFDVDRLKQLNSALTEERVNALLRQALRKSDLYRLQEGDECVAVVRAGAGDALAKRLQARLDALPLTPEERAAAGRITLTSVVMADVRDVRGALETAIRYREQAKRANMRGVVIIGNYYRSEA
jgi:hypothetical protein